MYRFISESELNTTYPTITRVATPARLAIVDKAFFIATPSNDSSLRCLGLAKGSPAFSRIEPTGISRALDRVKNPLEYAEPDRLRAAECMACVAFCRLGLIFLTWA
jgi:hypothetical protein